MEYEDTRRTPRQAVIADVELTDMQSGNQIRGRTKDLSLFGCGMESTKLFPKGTRVKIRLSHRGTEARALARVIYSKSDLGMGVVFTSVEPEDQRILEWWVAEFVCIPIREE